MSLNDPISDLLTRVRNAACAGHEDVAIPHSKIKESIAKIFMEEGFVKDVQVAGEGSRKQIIVTLKYAGYKKPVFTAIERESKPGRRVYVSNKEIKPMRQGMGVAVLSTPKGVLTDKGAKKMGVGGEVLCTIW